LIAAERNRLPTSSARNGGFPRCIGGLPGLLILVSIDN
jgi:hypothetical protein